MSSGPIRRSQLIAPFGVGALYTGRDRVSLISAGLDHWFEKEDQSGEIEVNEFKITEWRLQLALSVDHFRMPADYRKLSRYQEKTPNAFMSQPFLRFPRWHFCPDCRVLDERHLTEQGIITCFSSHSNKHKNKKRTMYQVPYIAICPKGHIQDFPWREWVHKALIPSCDHTLRYVSKGAGGVESEWVECDCGMRRSLQISLGTDQELGTGRLSDLATHVNDGDRDPPYLCQGNTPWLGLEEPSSCGETLSGVQRGASNVYFAHTRSSIYIPRGSESTPSELVTLIEENEMVQAGIRAVRAVNPTQEITASLARIFNEDLFKPYTDTEIDEAFRIWAETKAGTETGKQETEEYEEDAFRFEEFTVLRNPMKEKDLTVRAPAEKYDKWPGDYFEKIMLVDRLRETRALYGFTRVFEESSQTLEGMKSMLRRRPPSSTNNWLPAHIVFGEGIYFELLNSRVSSWEDDPKVKSRLQPLLSRYEEAQLKRHAEQKAISKRLVLLHTFAHVLINALTFECGYSAAALRERLYVSDELDQPMSGVLIYTASGDADGSMGGLVRMGKPGLLEPVIINAVESAKWCSIDPVCMEIGTAAGQGPDSCNLAACHNCALVPETSCELFNKLLDRATLVGALGAGPKGFFSE